MMQARCLITVDRYRAKHDGNGIRFAFSTVQVAGAMMRLPPWRARNWS
jgi:hypothetical protein